jgi:pimeloyl-ACP methyl ester carboxylesterase
MKNLLQLDQDVHLSYTDEGDPAGYPILIQHGLIASIDDVHLFYKLIHAGRRVISIARPGYGDSSPIEMSSFLEWARLVQPLIESLKLSHFDILACSSGAPYGYALAAAFPHTARKLYSLSGIPALYDEQVLALWPFPPIRGKSVIELEPLAKELFFSWVKETSILSQDVLDSMRNDCFGVAQDLRLRFMDWGFTLADVHQPVYMRHSKEDNGWQTAVLTANLLPDCHLELTETGLHFSPELLDEFIETTILITHPAR